MDQAPPGWMRSTLGEIGTYLNGRGFKKSEWRETGRPIIRIQNLTGSSTAFNYFQGEAEDRYIARPGDLLMSWAATLGAYFWNGPEAVVNQHIFKVQSKIDKRFHKYLLDFKLGELMRHTHGSGMVHITRGRFENVPVCVPDLPEQHRIVDILEDQLSRLDAATATLNKCIFRSNTLRSSVLHREITGSSIALGKLALSAGYGTSTKCAAGARGAPVARIPNLLGGKVDMSDEKRAVDPAAVSTGLLLKKGDLLIVRTNGSRDLIGRSATVDSDMEVAFASYLIRYQLDERKVLPRWVHFALESPSVRSQLEALAASSAGQHDLSLSKLDRLLIPCPEISMQQTILRHLDELENDRLRLHSALNDHLRRTLSLRQALLASALNGRLSGAGADMEGAQSWPV